MTETMNFTQEWDKAFELSEEVEHKKVNFTNHFGITLVADLYQPKGVTGKLQHFAVSGPFGAVKERIFWPFMLRKLAKRGYLAIAFDPSYTGESGGYPRYINSPDVNTEDYQAAVDYLVTHDQVDADRIGIIGILWLGWYCPKCSCHRSSYQGDYCINMY